MMQNSPLLVTKINPTNKPTEMKVNEKQVDETQQSFKDMLSKQVDQPESRSAEEEKTKLPEKLKSPRNKNEIEEIDIDKESLTNGNIEKSGALVEVDAQMLASIVTSEAIKDVTDGYVNLASGKEFSSLANIAPSIYTNNAAKEANQTLDAQSKTNSISDTKEAVVDIAKTYYTEEVVTKDPSEKEQFQIQQLIGKGTKSLNDIQVSQKFDHISESPSVPTVAAQPLIKTVQSSEEIQTNFSNFINVAPSKPGWNEAIGQKVAWMVGANEQSATLTLNPKDLGPLQIIINVNNEKADATFISDNPEVRKALEDGMSNLKQSMSQAGVELGQANVNTGKEHQAFHQANQGYSQKQASIAKESQATENVVHQSIVARVSNGLVDTFA
jgi:flagellar hook-length control protein FliK